MGAPVRPPSQWIEAALQGGQPVMRGGRWIQPLNSSDRRLNPRDLERPLADVPPLQVALLLLFPPAARALTAEWPGQPLEGTLVGWDGYWWWRRNVHSAWHMTGL